MDRVEIDGEVSEKLIGSLRDYEKALKDSARAETTLEEAMRRAGRGTQDQVARVSRMNEAMAKGGETVIGTARAFGVATAAIAAAGVAFVKFSEAAAHAEKQAAALRSLGSTYDEVSRATNDTLNATDVLAARQTFLSSRLRISGAELAMVARYAREHKQASMSSAEAVEKLSEALRGGEQDALQEWGIAVQSGATRAQTFERALAMMRREQEHSAPAARTLAEDTDRLKTSLEEGASAFVRMAADGLGLQGIISSIATRIRELARDINDMVDAANRRPQEQAAFQRRQQSLDNYIASLRTARQEAERLGIAPDAARRLIPSANPNQLTDEQRDALTTRLRSLTTGLQNRGTAPVTAADIASGTRTQYRGRFDVTQAPAITTNGADLDAQAVGIRAAMAASRRGQDTRQAQDLAQIRAGLAAIDRDADAQVAANLRAQQQTARPGPRDAAPAGAGAAQSQIDQQAIQALQRRISLARQGYQDEREALAATNTLREREVELQARSARGEVQQFEAETYQRLQRQDDLRASIALEARQLREVETLRAGLEAQRERTTSAAQQRALDDQIHTLREDELRLAREIATQQHDILDSEEAQTRAEAQREDAFRREQEQEDRNTPDRSDAGMFLTRQRERELAREDQLQEGRLERMRSFTDRWRDLHTEQVDVTAQAMDSISGAIDAGGEAIGGAWEAIVTGQKDVADALQDGLKSFLLSVAKREAIEGGVEIAKGLSALAGIYTAPLAPGHFAAAAAHFGIAAAAGVGGAAIPASASSSKGASGASSGPRERPLVGNAQNAAAGGGNTYNFTFGGGIIMGTPRDVAQGVVGLLNDPSNGAVINARRVQG